MCEGTNLLKDSFKGLFEAQDKRVRLRLPLTAQYVEYVVGLKSEIGAVSFSRNKALPVEGGLLKSGKVMLSPVSTPCIVILISNNFVRLVGCIV